MALNTLANKNLCIFGYGNYGRKVYEALSNAEEGLHCMFCDNDKTKHSDMMHEVIAPSKAVELTEKLEIDAIIIPSASSAEHRIAMISQLLTSGVKADIVFIADMESVQTGVGVTENIFRQIKPTELADICTELIQEKNVAIARLIFERDRLNQLHEDAVVANWSVDTKRKQWVCMQPFNRIEITRDEVYTCCPAHLKSGFSIGNTKDSLSDFFEYTWNSENARKLRYSVSKGCFEYCNQRCRYLRTPEQFPDVMRPRSLWEFDPSSWQDCKLSSGPTHIHVACDVACNLHCASCRTSVRVNSSEENKIISNILEGIVRPLLKDCNYLYTNGGGEFFASVPLNQFYKTFSSEAYPNLRLGILTNGTLLTSKRWRNLQNIHDMVDLVKVSIDAATKSTYEKLRRGARWSDIVINMDYLSSLRQSNQIARLEINFVVQSENYHEIGMFVELGEKWGVDKVNFSSLMNFGTFSNAAYMEKNVFNPKNPLYEHVYQAMLRAKSQSKFTEISFNSD